MPRAIGCFRRVGFPVEAYPVDWHTLPHLGLRRACWPSFTFGGQPALLDEAMHEWVGLLAYWLTGRTSSLFPAPRATP